MYLLAYSLQFITDIKRNDYASTLLNRVISKTCIHVCVHDRTSECEKRRKVERKN